MRRGRASAALIRTGAESAELDALFDVPPESPLAGAMGEMGYDSNEGLMVRRIISRSDRHRVYINGRLATMQTLGEMTAHLASISGQHAHQGLLKEELHLTILDGFGELTPLRDQYRRVYDQILPVIDSTPVWIDHRVMVTPFNAEKTLTKDTVPVDVDAVLFWLVWDAEKAALEVEDYYAAIAWAAQTALREVIGQMNLADILVGRAKMDVELQNIIDERTTPWGITVQSVEIRDIVIPQELEDAMSRQAQAERERQARVILGESEEQIAESFARAADAYAENPTALHLRAMNMLFEGLKEKGALMIVPSSAVDTMNLGGLGGMASLGAMVDRENGGGG